MCSPDTVRFHYRCHWKSLWVEISTLAYEANTVCWPERLSVAYCTHIIQTNLIFKNRRYPQIRCLQLQECPQPCLLYCWGNFYGLCCSNVQHRAVVALDLFCCHCRRPPYLSGIRFLKLCPSHRRNYVRQTIVVVSNTQQLDNLIFM